MLITADVLIAEATKWIGYKEKASNKDLDSFTANAGSKNYTRFARDLYKAGFFNGNKNGYDWCAVFVTACLYYLTEDKDKTNSIQMQIPAYAPYGAGVKYVYRAYRDAKRFDKNPQKGDQIIFATIKNGVVKSYNHTGLVEDVDDKYVYTIEGNTNNCVARHKYLRTNSSILGYGHPLFDTGDAPKPVAIKNLKVGDYVIFVGDKHYSNRNALVGKPCNCGEAKVTILTTGKHPIHLIHTGKGCTVYGFVDEKDCFIYR